MVAAIRADLSTVANQSNVDLCQIFGIMQCSGENAIEEKYFYIHPQLSYALLIAHYLTKLSMA